MKGQKVDVHAPLLIGSVVIYGISDRMLLGYHTLGKIASICMYAASRLDCMYTVSFTLKSIWTICSNLTELLVQLFKGVLEGP